MCQALTLSRGGWIGTAGAMLFLAVVLLLKKGFVHKRLVGTLLGAVVVIGLIIMASTPVVQRITTLTQGELEDELEGRRNIWAGILFIPVMLWIVYWFFRTGFTRLKSRSRQTQGITLGAMAALVALLIHSYSDGNLQIPANALLFTALAAAGLRKV
ncbi:hypothetical protein [Desulfotignum phosphitoxidans]|uniref:O-antigen polymerase n=1 Tax=Desulfotignum phosphitoxidans DSM 13687 TaxID=1286635 RepID=S0FR12_9BACT|nr:hypothetical protein [Desulfotignum phosphitoxidans]EMS77125.1 O-antigen polymerase [Desulfotignum phosphitoxidans DSM 13687]